VIRRADGADVAYLAHGLSGIAEHLKRVSDNPFVGELPAAPDAALSIARTFVDDPARFAFVAARDGADLGCVAAQIAPASVGWSRLQVGRIVGCWVEPQARRQSFGRRLTAAAEAECRRRGVAYVELAYVVDNAGAEAAWQALGYRPHRVFALKRLQD
jgi:ribosomal protein S18 acetylase RimI-like enzyme